MAEHASLPLDWSWPRRPGRNLQPALRRPAPAVPPAGPAVGASQHSSGRTISSQGWSAVLQRALEAVVAKDAPARAPSSGASAEFVSAVERCRQRLEAGMARLERVEGELTRGERAGYTITVAPVPDFDRLMTLHRALARSLDAESATVAAYRDGAATYSLVLTRPTLDMEALTKLRDALGSELTLTIRGARSGVDGEAFVIQPARHDDARTSVAGTEGLS